MFINYSTSSGLQSATTQLTSMPGALLGVDLMPPNAGYATLTVYDSNNANAGGSDLIISQLIVDAGTVGLNHEYFVPVAVNRGIYCTLIYTGGSTNANFFLRYSLG